MTLRAAFRFWKSPDHPPVKRRTKALLPECPDPAELRRPIRRTRAGRHDGPALPPSVAARPLIRARHPLAVPRAIDQAAVVTVSRPCDPVERTARFEAKASSTGPSAMRATAQNPLHIHLSPDEPFRSADTRPSLSDILYRVRRSHRRQAMLHFFARNHPGLADPHSRHGSPAQQHRPAASRGSCHLRYWYLTLYFHAKSGMSDHYPEPRGVYCHNCLLGLCPVGIGS